MHYVEWGRRIRRGKVSPWSIRVVNLTMPDPDDLYPVPECGWEFVVLPEGEHPDPRQVPGREAELGGEGGGA